MSRFAVQPPRGTRPYSASSGVGAQVNTIQNTKPQIIKGGMKFKMNKDIILLLAADGILVVLNSAGLINEDGFMKFKLAIAALLLLKVFILK